MPALFPERGARPVAADELDIIAKRKNLVDD
jgi:hypothetical protein